MFEFVLHIQFLSCTILVGLIWTIQLVHYPSFYWIEPGKFADFEKFHQLRIGIVVIPLMSLEFISAIVLIFLKLIPLFIVNLVGVIFIWGVTLFISVPLHNKLSKEMDEKLIARLIQTNWIRTGLWSARLVLLLYGCNLVVK